MICMFFIKFYVMIDYYFVLVMDMLLYEDQCFPTMNHITCSSQGVYIFSQSFSFTITYFTFILSGNIVLLNVKIRFIINSAVTCFKVYKQEFICLPKEVLIPVIPVVHVVKEMKQKFICFSTT